MRRGFNSIAKTVTRVAIGGAIGAGTVGSLLSKSLSKERKMSEKHLALFQLMTQWVKVKQEGKNLALWFEDKGYKKIAIYGMSYAGETLVNELMQTGIQVAYGIDRNAEQMYAEVDVVTMEDELEEVDVIVVTAITFFDEIEEKLSEKMNCPIVSLEDILYEV